MIRVDEEMTPRRISALSKRLETEEHPAVQIDGMEDNTHLRFLGDLPPIERLVITDSGVKSYEGLEAQPKLKYLFLTEPTGRVKPSVEVLRSLPELRFLGIDGKKSDFETIGHLRKLRSLHLARTTVPSDVGSLKQLRVLHLVQMKVRDFQWLKVLTNLRFLKLAVMLDTLEALPESTVDFMLLSGVRIPSLQSIGRHARLRRLYLVDCKKLSTLEGIEDVRGLEDLRLMGLKLAIEDVERIKQLKKLKVLHSGVRPRKVQEALQELIASRSIAMPADSHPLYEVETYCAKLLGLSTEE